MRSPSRSVQRSARRFAWTASSKKTWEHLKLEQRMHAHKTSLEQLITLLQKHSEIRSKGTEAPITWSEDYLTMVLKSHQPRVTGSCGMVKIWKKLAWLDLCNLSCVENCPGSIHVHAMPVLNIVGPPGAGKTLGCEVGARLLDRKFFRVSCSANASWDDLFGMTLPGDDGEFVFQEGTLVQALRKGALILFDEVNLLPEELLRKIAEIISRSGIRTLEVRDRTLQLEKPPLFVAAMNRASLGGGRTDLPEWFAELLCNLHVNCEGADNIIEALYEESSRQSYNDELGERGSEEKLKLAVEVAKELYREHELMPRKLQRISRLHLGLQPSEQGTLSEREELKERARQYLRLPSRLVSTDGRWFEDALRWLGLATVAGPFTLLTGPTCSGKTTLIQRFAQDQQKQLITICAHAGSTASDFLGSFMPDASVLQPGARVKVRSAVDTRLDGEEGRVLSLNVDTSMCTVLMKSDVRCIHVLDVQPMDEESQVTRLLRLRFLKGGALSHVSHSGVRHNLQEGPGLETSSGWQGARQPLTTALDQNVIGHTPQRFRCISLSHAFTGCSRCKAHYDKPSNAGTPGYS